MRHETEHLRRYAATGSEDDFAAVVRRCLPLVYAAALRRLAGDVHLAQDVTQLVFTALARNARAVAKHPDLTGWLFTTTRFLAAKAVRRERRRRAREQQSALAGDMSDDAPSASAAPLDALLDELLMDLRQLDRQVILLRFHRGLRLAEIGAQLGATENAVQKRLDRALDRLREKLARRGVTSTAAALALAFEQQSVVALPAGLVGAATSAGLAGGSSAAGMLTVSSVMAVSKFQLGVAAVVTALTTAGLVWQVHETSTLRAEISTQTAAADARTVDLTNNLAALMEHARVAEADAAALAIELEAAQAAQAAAASRPRTLTDPREQFMAARSRASALQRENKFQEAIEEYLRSYHDLAGRLDEPFQQIVMHSIETLGRKYPPALEALRDLRDAAMQKLQASPNNRELIAEVALLNERLGEGRLSMALYDSLPPEHPGRQAIAVVAHTSFVEARRYADVLVGKSFGAMLSELELRERISAHANGRIPADHLSYPSSAALTNIEALAGAGKLEDARVLTEKLLALDDSEVMRAAIRRHVERALEPPAP